jgi:peptide/nickel transport system substrate-binding protein
MLANKKWAKLFALLIVSGLIFSACSTPTPEVVEKVITKEVEKVVTQIVKETVKETVIVEGTPQIVEKEVTKIVEVTKEVEKVVTATPEPKTLTVGLSADAESMDPFFVNQAAGWSVVHALYDHLIDRDFDGNLVPGLAESWTVVTPVTLEFNLRQGVTFHNGEPFDAESVKFSVERMLAKEEAPNRNKFTSIDSVEIVDAYTVHFNLNKSDGTLFDSLTSRLAMLPPKYMAEVGDEGFAAAPVGTGPFSFVEWVPDDHVTLAANGNYWEGSYKGMPKVATVVVRPIPEDATRLAELQTGGIDIMQDLSSDQIAAVGTAGMIALPDETFQLAYVFFITDDESLPTYDVRVRRALNYAVDVNLIIETLLGGYGSRIGSPIGPGYLGYNPDVEPYAYDPEMAIELLTEAGYPNGFEVTMDISTSDRADTAEAVAGQLAEIGIDVTIREFDIGQYNQNWMDRTQSPLWRARWGNTPDPQSIGLFASCTGWISRYCNEEVTELLNAAQETLDQEERASSYSQASQLMHDDPLAIYLWTSTQIYGLNPRVRDFQPSPLLALIVSGVSVLD